MNSAVYQGEVQWNIVYWKMILPQALPDFWNTGLIQNGNFDNNKDVLE